MITETPTTTLQIFPTADGRQSRVTCPFHEKPPLIMRGDHYTIGLAMSQHVAKAHGWRVTGVQILGVPAPKKEQK